MTGMDQVNKEQRIICNIGTIGTIDLAEMVEITGTLFELEGVSRVSCRREDIEIIIHAQELAPVRARQIFDILDNNGDGELEEEEFITGCLEDQELISFLNSGGLEEIPIRENENNDEDNDNEEEEIPRENVVNDEDYVDVEKGEDFQE